MMNTTLTRNNDSRLATRNMIVLFSAIMLAALDATESFALVVGPDSFGYVGKDSSEPDGPIAAAAFVDISTLGTFVTSGDEAAGTVTLPIPFEFYGISYTDLRVSTNGYISTDLSDPGSDFSNDASLPAVPSTGGGARIYPLHDDLDVTGSVWYLFEPAFGTGTGVHPTSIFMWQSTQHFAFNDGILFDFNVLLNHDTGAITFAYDGLNPEEGSGSTTGIQNDGATIGLQYAANAAGSIPDDLFAVRFTLEDDGSGPTDPGPEPGPGPTNPGNPAPEPSTAMLAALSLLALGVTRRRKRH